MDSPDMSRFTSRFHYRGRLVFDSAHRIGAERSLAVDAPDTPILRTIDGLPYIPGSSIKGAWRSYTEAVLRTLQESRGHGKFASDPLVQKGVPEYGLTDEKVRNIKTDFRDRSQDELDAYLRRESTWTERLFGNAALSSKALIKDAYIDRATWLRSEVRDGVAIDRDSGRAGDGLKYQFEVVPAGAAFPLEIVVENASPAELGLVVLGIRAFERGEILLGGAKSRGLGWCHLESDNWSNCRYVTAENLLDYLLGDSTGIGLVDEPVINGWISVLRESIENDSMEVSGA
jgi:CRISPR-associated RAMP protein (TIGR02581 family)